jgi:elongation factor Ts
MSFTAADVMKLRDRTKLPMMECKAALTESGGDLEQAVAFLRKKFANAVAKFADREAAEGRVAIYIDPAKKVGAIVEMRCETAPSAKAEPFIQLAADVAKQVALSNPASVEDLLKLATIDDPKKTIQDRVTETVGLIRENMKVQRFGRFEGLIGEYCHHDGSVGVLLLVEGTKADAQLLRDVCMHVAARNPVSAVREDVPAETVAKELEIAKAQAAQTGKPANIVDKIAEGKMKTWYAENVLVEQPFVKDDSKTVGDLLKGAGLKMSKFLRYKVGELT